MRFVPLATALAAVLAVAAPAAAAVPAQCALVAPPASRTFAVVLAGGARATVVDRYGGAFQRTRRFVQWTVRMSGFSGSAPVSAADFVVDGRVVHTDDTIQSRRPGQATLQWATSSNGFAAGDHQLVIRLHQRTGETREIEIPFTATNCPFASFSAE